MERKMKKLRETNLEKQEKNNNENKTQDRK